MLTTLCLESIIALGVLVGTMLGQLFFGFMADKMSRKKMFITTLALVICFAAASAFSFEINGQVWMILALFRFFLGLGIGAPLTGPTCIADIVPGGEYPLSATISAETSPLIVVGGWPPSSPCKESVGPLPLVSSHPPRQSAGPLDGLPPGPGHGPPRVCLASRLGVWRPAPFTSRLQAISAGLLSP